MSRRPEDKALAMKVYLICGLGAAVIAVGIGIIYPVATTLVLLAVAGAASGLHLLARPRPLHPLQLPPTRHSRSHTRLDDPLA